MVTVLRSLAVGILCVLPGGSTLVAPSVGGSYILQDLGGGKGSFLLHTWNRAAMDLRANGFQPSSEALGNRALRLKQLTERLPKMVSQAKIIGTLSQGTTPTFDGTDAQLAQRLSKTRLAAALSAGKGSALAFVSEWPDHVSIDACVVNPSYLIAGEDAEAVLLENVAQQALASGITNIRLPRPSYQVEGDLFYERCGFFASEDGTDAAEDRVLYYRTSAP